MSNESPRRLVILRHAKADWSEYSDYDRPLADRGREDAPTAGRWLAGTEIDPDLVLCSSAARAKETLKLVADELPQRPQTLYEDRLYEASLGEHIAIVNETSDEVEDLLLVGHNPGMHALADALAGGAEGDFLTRMNRGGFPPAAIAVLTFEAPWSDVEHGTGTLVDYWSPRA